MSDWCATHPRYSGKKRPTTKCPECLRLYFFRCPEEKQIVLDSYEELGALQKDFTITPTQEAS